MIVWLRWLITQLDNSVNKIIPKIKGIQERYMAPQYCCAKFCDIFYRAKALFYIPFFIDGLDMNRSSECIISFDNNRRETTHNQALSCGNTIKTRNEDEVASFYFPV
ncbi:MAG: hypothetical protein DWQ10_17725 [Calditrichaeota bacterium]|nr:MAG: hypothetical protein DWQ10_17725 [Calditrichota bacterium]